MSREQGASLVGDARWSAAVSSAALASPVLIDALSLLIPFESSDPDELASIDGRWRVSVGRRFWTLNRRQSNFVLIHLCMHMIARHFDRAKAAGIPVDRDSLRAMDMEIDPQIAIMPDMENPGYPMPSDDNLPKGRSMEEYRAMIGAANANTGNESQPPPSGAQTPDSDGSRGKPGRPSPSESTDVDTDDDKSNGDDGDDSDSSDDDSQSSADGGQSVDGDDGEDSDAERKTGASADPSDADDDETDESGDDADAASGDGDAGSGEDDDNPADSNGGDSPDGNPETDADDGDASGHGPKPGDSSDGGADAPGDGERTPDEVAADAGSKGVSAPLAMDIIDSIKSTVDRARTEMESQGASHGTVGTALEHLILDAMKPPKVDWRARLASIMSQSRASKSYMRTERTFSRINARASAFVPDVIMPGLTSYQPKVMMGVDTSGSMSTKEIGRALTEAQGIIESAAATGDFSVFCVDSEVKDIQTVSSMDELDIRGGGGTDMDVAFRYVSELEPMNRPDVFILATDGFVDWRPCQRWLPDWNCETVILIVNSKGMKNIPEWLDSAADVVDISA